VIIFTRIKTKSYLLISFCSVICLTLLGSSILTNAAFGQNTSLAGPSIGLQQQQSTVPKLHLVKIISPTKGEQVPVGKDLSISGTSVDNGTSGCKVSVKVNFVNPYHDALPIAAGAQNNSYSKWNFTLTSAYTSIHPGQNKIIAKFSCADNPNLISKATVNVTGAGIQPPTMSQPSQQQIAVRSNGTTSPFFLPSSLSLASALSNSTSNSTNTPSVIPVSGNSSSIIDPPSTQSSSSSSNGHSHITHHSHQTHHSSGKGGSSSSSSSRVEHHSSSSKSHTHSGSENHKKGNGGHSSDSHHGSSGGGHDFFHGAFTHFGQSISKSVTSHFGQ
jgi:hypothetical protein